MKYNGIAFLLCIASLCPTLSGQHTGKGQVVSRRNLEGTAGLGYLLPDLPAHFDKLPDEIKVQIVHQMIAVMPLEQGLQTLSSLASTNKNWNRISHDKAFDSYWALIHDEALFEALNKKKLIKAIQIIQKNPKLQKVNNHSWAILFHQMITTMPLEQGLQTLSSLASTNEYGYRISHDKTFDSYWALIRDWALIHDEDLFEALNKKKLIKAIQIIQKNPKLQKVDNHSWAIIFHERISYLPTDLIEKVLNFALDAQAITAFCAEHSYLNRWLIKAAESSDAPEVLYALIAGADIYNRFGEDTALLKAVEANNPFIVRLLLDDGAFANTTYHGYSVLSIAAVRGYVDIVKLLLDYGANRADALARLEFLQMHYVQETPNQDEVIQLLKTYKI